MQPWLAEQTRYFLEDFLRLCHKPEIYQNLSLLSEAEHWTPDKQKGLGSKTTRAVFQLAESMYQELALDERIDPRFLEETLAAFGPGEKGIYNAITHKPADISYAAIRSLATDDATRIFCASHARPLVIFEGPDSRRAVTRHTAALEKARQQEEKRRM
jgi:hypothetical protein